MTPWPPPTLDAAIVEAAARNRTTVTDVDAAARQMRVVFGANDEQIVHALAHLTLGTAGRR